MPKVKKQKQKQKQRQSQRVVVNIHNKAPTPRRRRSTTTAGKSSGVNVPYPVYLNAPSDYAPIIHNLPQQFTNQPAITMPVQALANIPTGQTQPTVLPTTLQTNTEGNKPLVLAIKRPTTPPTKPPPMGSLAEQILKEHAKRAEKKLAKELTGVKEAVKDPGSNIPRSTTLSPFQVELIKKIDERALTEGNLRLTPQLPQQFTDKPSSSPSLIRPIPIPHGGNPFGIRATPSPKLGRPREFTDEENERKKAYNNTPEGKREMAERQLFAREDPKSAKFGRI